MRQIVFKNNLTILLSLVLIGFLVHFKSLQMVPYGDDWRLIYNYFTHEEVVANFSPFPGLFAYMAPYGPSALVIGVLYQVFGHNYYIYYLVPLIFKILTAFVIFLTLKKISALVERSDYSVGFLAATLFLVGTTGIQAIDWAFHINVFIALFIFASSLYFQISFYQSGGKRNLVLGLLLSLLAILTAPFRLSPLILLVPLFDLIMLYKISDKGLFTVVLLKNIVYAIVIFTFFIIGLFGHEPEDIYSPSSSPLLKLIQEVSSDPMLSIRSFLHWVGLTIVPAYPAGNPNSFIFGTLFLIAVLAIFLMKRNKFIILFSALFFIPLFSMWTITTLKNTDSGDKYLSFSFLGLCYLIGVLSINADKVKKALTAIILSLVLIQAYSTIRIYSYWISIGRGSDFIIPVQEKIMSHFPSPITEYKIIYLDFDNAAVQQSVEFGIGYRVAVLSKTKGLDYFPVQVSKEENLIKLIQEKGKNGEYEKIIGNVYSFRYKNTEFFDITDTTQEKLRNIFED